MGSVSLKGYYLPHIDAKPWPGILRDKRLTLRLTQQQVADKAKIKVQQYQKFESGERNIMTCSFQIACRVIEALDMDITAFFHGEYVMGEEIYLEDGILKFKKTGRPVDEDVK